MFLTSGLSSVSSSGNIFSNVYLFLFVFLIIIHLIIYFYKNIINIIVMEIYTDNKNNL